MPIRRSFRLRISWSVLMLLASATTCWGQDHAFEIIEHPDSRDTLIHGINNFGVVVGQHGMIDFSSTFNAGSRGFVFDGNVFTDVFFPGSVSTSANGINDSGVVVGEYVDNNGKTRGFLFDGADYESIITPFASEASAADINNSGMISGVFSSRGFTSDTRGFRLSEGEFTDIAFPQSNQTFLDGINDAGHIAGTFLSQLEGGAFITNDFAPIPVTGIAADGRSVNDRGQVVGNVREIVADAGLVDLEIITVGYRYDQATGKAVDIPFPTEECTFVLNPFDPTVAEKCNRALRDINDHGVIAGYADAADGHLFGFVASPLDRVPGDFDENGELATEDLDQLALAMTDGTLDDSFDLDRSGSVDFGDRLYWVQTLRNTWIGDANLDGRFSTDDVVNVFAAGEYEDDTDRNSSWQTGDWNGDLEFNTQDIVAAFQDGGFEQGPRVRPVPEPSVLSLTVCWIGFIFRRPA